VLAIVAPRLGSSFGKLRTTQSNVEGSGRP
jgi:hypothetical protein